MNTTSRSRAGIKPNLRIIQGEPSWRIASDNVEAFVTETGGQLGPVTFERSGRKLKPYSVAPWAKEPARAKLPPVIRALRGDFFCLPFGGNESACGQERHPVHGETANGRWRFGSLDTTAGYTCLHLSLETKVRPGRVDKRITLVRGQNAIYSEHIISGMSGPMNLGHHAMLKFPEKPGSGLVSTSRFVYGQVFPGVFELPEKRGYSALKQGAEFESPSAVPTASGETADLTRYPARRGFEDLVLLVSDAEREFAWTAVAFPAERYVWFALKDPRVLRQTIFWLSNGGRHYPPWSGRHVTVMGLEEVTACFHYGLAESVRPNGLSAKGFPTSVDLDPKEPLAVRYLMGTARIQAGFDHVASIEPAEDGRGIVLHSESGRQAQAAVGVEFLRGGTAGLIKG